MASSVLILFRDFGPVYRRNLGAFVRAAHEYSHEVVVLASEDTPDAAIVADHVERCPSLDQVADVRTRVENICKRHDIVRIFPSFESEVTTAALCREDNAIEGLQPEQAVLFRDKNAMNRRARELGVPVPEECLPSTLGALEEFVAQVGFPIIVKPFDGMACKATWKVSTNQELLEAWARIRNERHDYRAERFLQGRQFHVDALIQNGELVFELLSEYAHSLIDNYRIQGVSSVTWPPQQRNAVHHELLEQHRKILRGFGLRTGAAHTEFYVTDDGHVFFGESGARLGGGYIAPMIRAAYVADLAAEWLKIDLDSEYRPQLTLSRNVGAMFIPARACGRITAIASSAELQSEPSVLDAEVWRGVNDVLLDPTMCCDALGYAVCEGTSVDDVLKRMATIREGFRLQTDLATAPRATSR